MTQITYDSNEDKLKIEVEEDSKVSEMSAKIRELDAMGKLTSKYMSMLRNNKVMGKSRELIQAMRAIDKMDDESIELMFKLKEMYKKL